MKRARKRPDTGETSESPDNDTAAESDAPSGLRWLKYTGIGPSRTGGEARGKLSGDAITSLGSLEAEILGLLWEIGHPATGTEVMEQSLYRRRAQGQEPIAFATIATTLRRLTEKGVLVATKNAQRAIQYEPAVEREAMAARILNNVSVTLLGKPLHALLPRLLGNETAPRRGRDAAEPEEDAAVRRLLDALEKAAQGKEKEPEADQS